MSDTALLLFALALVVAFAVAGVGGVLGWVIVGFLIACGIYIARATFSGPYWGGGMFTTQGGAERKKAW